MKKEWLVKTLAMGVVVLFVSVSFQPLIAENTIAVGKEPDYINMGFEQAKEYLFQTLIDIFNNPKINGFLNEHKQDLITNNCNKCECKNTIKKIRLQNPKLLKSILLTKPEMTYEYLEKSYNTGLEMINIIGEEKSLKIVESVKIANSKLFIELKNIIANDKELSNKILVLEEMNKELKPYSTYYPIYCCILLIILINFLIKHVFFLVLYDFFYKIFPSFKLFERIVYFYVFMVTITFFLMVELDCADYPTPPHLSSYKS